jgi:hypothetical protein
MKKNITITEISHFDDWVMDMVINSDYDEVDLMEFREHYDKKLDFDENTENFMIFHYLN